MPVQGKRVRGLGTPCGGWSCRVDAGAALGSGARRPRRPGWDAHRGAARPGRPHVRPRHLLAAVPRVRRRGGPATATDVNPVRHRRADPRPALHREPVPGRPGRLGPGQCQAGPRLHDRRLPDRGPARRPRRERPVGLEHQGSPAVERGVCRGHVRARDPGAGGLRPADGVDRRRAARGPALAERHRGPASREPLRHRGTHAGTARRGRALRPVLLRGRMAGDHRLLVAARRPGLGHRWAPRLPDGGAGPLHPGQLLRWPGPSCRSGTTTWPTTTAPAAPTPSPRCRCRRRPSRAPPPTSTATGRATSWPA